MAGSVRCSNCGGLNPAGAEWCGQCLQRFPARTPPPPPPPLGDPAATAGGTAADPVAPGAATTAGAPAPARGAVKQAGAFTVTEEGITWTCSRCDETNPLDASECVVCGTTFADSMRPPVERPARDPNTVAMYSLFFPGAGHWYMGMKGAAVARGVLSTWVVFVAIAAGIAGSILMASMFGLAAFALWAIAAHDAYREAVNQPAAVILKSKVFVYLVVGLLMLMVALLVAAGFQANR